MRSIVRSDLIRAGIAALVLASAGLVSGEAAAQETRDVVSKEVAVGRSEAILRLGIAGGSSLEIALADGNVSVDDEVVGTYTIGGSLDAAWRSLLGTAVALENGPLSTALVSWSPPSGLGAEAAVADAVDRALDDALTAPPPEAVEAPAVPEAEQAPEAPVSGLAELQALTRLLGRTDRLVGLAEALDDLDVDDLRLTVEEDFTVEPGDEIEATVVVVDGDLEVRGLIRGDAVVVGGDVILSEGGRITGELRYADGRVIDQGGEVERGIRGIEASDVVMSREIEDRVRREVQRARESERRDRGWNPLSGIGRALGGIIGTLFKVLVLGVIGGLFLYFAGPNVDAIAETARRSPGRAAVVGTAGAFLVLPAWILGIIGLAISIIGIPALILWVPLFPIAVMVAGAVGYLAVARNVGSWLARQDFPYLAWVRVTNPYSLIFGGLLVLVSPWLAGDLVRVVPFLGALRAFLVTAGTVATVFALAVGFGAVILTRGGRRPEFWGEDLFTPATPGAGWEDIDVEAPDTSTSNYSAGADETAEGGAGPDAGSPGPATDDAPEPDDGEEQPDTETWHDDEEPPRA